MAIKRNLFRDILRDTNSRKFSMTKFVTFTANWMLIAAVVSGIAIMIINKEVDHILIGELIALVLTLLGFKNFRGNFRSLEVPATLPTPQPKGDDLETAEDKDDLG